MNIYELKTVIDALIDEAEKKRLLKIKTLSDLIIRGAVEPEAAIYTQAEYDEMLVERDARILALFEENEAMSHELNTYAENLLRVDVENERLRKTNESYLSALMIADCELERRIYTREEYDEMLAERDAHVLAMDAERNQAMCERDASLESLKSQRAENERLRSYEPHIKALKTRILKLHQQREAAHKALRFIFKFIDDQGDIREQLRLHGIGVEVE